MLDAPTPALWAELRAKRPISEDALATIPVKVGNRDTDSSLGIDQAGHLHLLIPVIRGPRDAKPPDLNGLKFRHRHTELGQYLDLISHPSHERVFTPVCKEI